ncbi:MAG TPA: hypothetical protein DDZ66_02860 [Firmicutes bacterium]|jgi:putative nucleotidyltransferase with HDIG domain|nr:hypothetical protein [Bacillota bacterium]
MNNKLRTTWARASALVGLDPATLRHSQRVQRLSLVLGENLGLSSAELNTLSLGSLLHDVGKKHIPRAILLKEEPLSVEDWKAIQQHPVSGWEYVKKSVLDERVREIILHHHLWFDGQGGYPESSKGVRPSFLTQIASVADVVDAMTQDRPYRRALSLDTSLDFLAEKSGTQFCPSVVEAVHKNLNQIIKLVIA